MAPTMVTFFWLIPQGTLNKKQISYMKHIQKKYKPKKTFY